MIDATIDPEDLESLDVPAPEGLAPDLDFASFDVINRIEPKYLLRLWASCRDAAWEGLRPRYDGEPDDSVLTYDAVKGLLLVSLAALGAWSFEEDRPPRWWDDGAPTSLLANSWSYQAFEALQSSRAHKAMRHLCRAAYEYLEEAETEGSIHPDWKDQDQRNHWRRYMIVVGLALEACPTTNQKQA